MAQTVRATIESPGRTFTVPSGFRGVLVLTDSTEARCGIYIVATTGLGLWVVRPVIEASGVSIDTSTAYKMTITPNNGSRIVLLISLQGSVT